MRYDITEDGEAVEILVHDAGGRAPQVLASLQSCQEGRCGCPTDQYDRLESIEVGGGDGELTIHLTPRPGEHLDPDALRACMDYTLESASTLSRRRARIVAEVAPLMPPTQTDRDARWLRAARQAKALAWFSLACMTGEGVLGLVAGITANSISLIGWALGSVIVGLASIIVIWRFTGSRNVSETSERRAQRAVAVSFFLLAPYIGVESIRDLGGAHEMTPSVLGVAVTAASLVVMPLLGRAKQRLGERLDSRATAGEGMQKLPVRRSSRGCAARAGRDGSVWVGLA